MVTSCMKSIRVGVEELADGGGSATDPDVLAVRCLAGLLQRILGGCVDELEARAVVEVDRRVGVVGQHEDRCTEGRLASPPAAPAVVVPHTAVWAELAAAHDLGADPLTPGGLSARSKVTGASVWSPPWIARASNQANSCWASLIGASSVTCSPAPKPSSGTRKLSHGCGT